MDLPHRVCKKCKISKPANKEHFHERRQGSRTYLNTACKKCKNEISSAYRQTFAGKLAEIRARSAKKSPEVHAQFDLTVDYIADLDGYDCTYCDDEIVAGQLDRTDNTKGYTQANCIPCCEDCNRMKSDLTEDEFLRRVFRIARNFNEPE